MNYEPVSESKVEEVSIASSHNVYSYDTMKQQTTKELTKTQKVMTTCLCLLLNAAASFDEFYAAPFFAQVGRQDGLDRLQIGLVWSASFVTMLFLLVLSTYVSPNRLISPKSAIVLGSLILAASNVWFGFSPQFGHGQPMFYSSLFARLVRAPFCGTIALTNLGYLFTFVTLAIVFLVLCILFLVIAPSTKRKPQELPAFSSPLCRTFGFFFFAMCQCLGGFLLRGIESTFGLYVRSTFGLNVTEVGYIYGMTAVTFAIAAIFVGFLVEQGLAVGTSILSLGMIGTVCIFMGPWSLLDMAPSTTITAVCFICFGMGLAGAAVGSASFVLEYGEKVGFNVKDTSLVPVTMEMFYALGCIIGPIADAKLVDSFGFADMAAYNGLFMYSFFAFSAFCYFKGIFSARPIPASVGSTTVDSESFELIP